VATLTLYATESLAGVYQGLTESSPAADALAAPATGWIVSTGSTNRSEFRPRVERAATTFANTTPPDGSLDTTNGDGFRSATTYTGVFSAAETWSFSFAARAATSASGQDGRAYCRVFRSANEDGSGATEITSGAVEGTIVTNLTTSATQTSTCTFEPGEVTLSGEYLFVQVAWGRTGAASMTGADVNMFIGATGTRLVTASFIPSFTLTVAGSSLGVTMGNITLTTTTVLADKEITLSAPTGYTAHAVANIDEILNWRCIYYGLGVEIGDRILYATAGASVDADGLVTGVSTLAFYWRDADNDGGTWSTEQTWVSEELVVQNMALGVTMDSVFFPGNTVASRNITLSAPSGYSTHAVTDISQIADPGCIYYYLDGISVGCRIIYDSTTTTNAWLVEIDSQGFVIVDSNGGSSNDSFDYSVRDITDESWSPDFGTFGLVDALTVADSTLGVLMNSPTLTQQSSLTVQGMSLGTQLSEPALLSTGAISVNGITLGLSMTNVSLNNPDADTESPPNTMSSESTIQSFTERRRYS